MGVDLGLASSPPTPPAQPPIHDHSRQDRFRSPADATNSALAQTINPLCAMSIIDCAVLMCMCVCVAMCVRVDTLIGQMRRCLENGRRSVDIQCRFTSERLHEATGILHK